MPKQFDSHNAVAAFDHDSTLHDSTLVVALELSGKSEHDEKRSEKS